MVDRSYNGPSNSLDIVESHCDLSSFFAVAETVRLIPYDDPHLLFVCSLEFIDLSRVFY